MYSGDDAPKPSGVGSPVGQRAPQPFGSAGPSSQLPGRPGSARAPGGDVLGGGGDVLGPGHDGNFGDDYDGGYMPGSVPGPARPASAALARAREMQLKKRSERLMTEGMAVASNAHPPGAMGPGYGAQPQQGSYYAPRGDLGASLDSSSSRPNTGLAQVPLRAAPVDGRDLPPAYDSGDVTPRGTYDAPVQPFFVPPPTQRAIPEQRSSSEEALADNSVSVRKAEAQRVPPREAGADARSESPMPTEHLREESGAAVTARPVPTTAAPPGTSASLPARPPTVDLSDMRGFLDRPAPSGPLVQCHIVRTKGGFMASYPKYTMYLKHPGGADTMLLAARKRGQSKSSNYLISLDQDDLSRESGAFFGKLRSNFIGTEFVLYDAGLNPEKAAKAQNPGVLAPPRQELCAVLYKQNVLYTRGPRKMTVLMPVIENGRRKVLQPAKSHDESCIVEKHKINERDRELFMMKNKSPKWNEAANAYVLNFNGRVTQPSVKNFQLVDYEDEEEVVVMQFGRVGDNEFTCDFQYPISPLQAFGIALSSFDYKIACE